MIVKKIFFSLIPIILIIIFIEILLSIVRPNVLKIDSELGWVIKKNVNFNLIKKDFFGNNYKVNFYTDKDGLRIYEVDKYNKVNIKIFVIGDSFTSDPYASNDKMWFSEIAKQIHKKYNKNVIVYSLGAGGYGNLQQLLAIKQLKKEKKINDIDFFILQFCNNDFLNNSIEIEKKLNNLNQSSRRPYLVNSEIVYNDNFISKILRTPLIGESRILNKFIFLISKIIYNEKDISREEFKKTLLNTDFLLSKIKDELPIKPFLIFNCSEINSWPYSTLPSLAKKNKFYYLEYPSKISLSKINFTLDQSHWSEIGNINVGKELFYQIEKIDEIKVLLDK